MPGFNLETMIWTQAQAVLTPECVVVIPLGAQSKEHGYHLQLNTDWLIAEYLKQRVVAVCEVVVVPTVNYHFFPSFVEYPGSITLRLETARDLIVDICQSLSVFGPRRFYVLNTGVSTVRPLKAAAEELALKSIVLRYTAWNEILAPVEASISEQEGGGHADEIETSIMLYVAPNTVTMEKAVNEFRPGDGPLTRDPSGEGVYSASGVWGDATLATVEKGRLATEALVKGVLADIEDLRNAAVIPHS